MHQRKRHSHFSRLALSFGPAGAKIDHEADVGSDDQTVSFRSTTFSKAKDLGDRSVSFESLDVEGEHADLPADSDGQVLLAPIRDVEAAADPFDVDPSSADLAAAIASALPDDAALSAQPVLPRRDFGFLRSAAPEKIAEPDASLLSDVHVDPADAEDGRSIDVHDEQTRQGPVRDHVADDTVLPRLTRSTVWGHPTEVPGAIAESRGASPPPKKIAFAQALGTGCMAVGAGSARVVNATMGIIGRGIRRSVAGLKVAVWSSFRGMAQFARILVSAVQRAATVVLVRVSKALSVLVPWLKSAATSVLKAILRAGTVLSSSLAHMVTAIVARTRQAGSALSSGLGMAVRSSAAMLHQLRLACTSTLKAILRAETVLSSGLARMVTAIVAGTGQAGSALSSGLGMAVRSSAVKLHQLRLACLSGWRSAVAALRDQHAWWSFRSVSFGGSSVGRGLGVIRQRHGLEAGLGAPMRGALLALKKARSMAANIVPFRNFSAGKAFSNIIPKGAAMMRWIVHRAGAPLTSIVGGFRRRHLAGLAIAGACILLAVIAGNGPQTVAPHVMLAIPEKSIPDQPISFPWPSSEIILQKQADRPYIQASEETLERSIPDLAAIDPVPAGPTGQPGSSDPKVALKGAEGGLGFLSPEEALAQLISAVAPAKLPALTAEAKASEDNRRAASSFLLSEVEKVAGVREFTRAVRAVGLETLIRPGQPYTLFVPNDAAFAELGPERLETLLARDGHDQLRTLLTSHILHEHLEFSDFAGEVGSYTSLADRPIAITATDVIRVENASMIETDLKAVNMVIHVIDKVLPLRDARTTSPPSSTVQRASDDRS